MLTYPIVAPKTVQVGIHRRHPFTPLLTTELKGVQQYPKKVTTYQVLDTSYAIPCSNKQNETG